VTGYLIVNGDDLGASRGVNRGILEAHRDGILTSASLMVDMPASEEAGELACGTPDLSVGLHVAVTHESGAPRFDWEDADRCRAELARQLERFEKLTGKLPTHLDAHHNTHRDPRLLPHFLELAERAEVPLREHSPVRYFSEFYGRWDGESHPEQISVESLLQMVETEFIQGCSELSCHPGYADADFPTEYSIERELELRTLCHPSIRVRLDALGIRLIGYGDLAAVGCASGVVRRSSWRVS
jgi:predicted glycoside hydrolase/deacetylase ChbG (UPF0249 family)